MDGLEFQSAFETIAEFWFDALKAKMATSTAATTSLSPTNSQRHSPSPSPSPSRISAKINARTPSPRDTDSPKSIAKSPMMTASNGGGSASASASASGSGSGSDNTSLPVIARTVASSPEHPKSPEAPGQSPHQPHYYPPFQRVPYSNHPRYAMKGEPSQHLAQDHHSTVSGKPVPIRCVIEAITSLEGDGAKNPIIEKDNYVVIPDGTTFQNIISVVLTSLDYPKETASMAKGWVVLKNWKPLSFDAITDNFQMTVGQLLGELSTSTTLRIQILRIRPPPAIQIKDKLFRIALPHINGILISGGCPLNEATLLGLYQSPATFIDENIPGLTKENISEFDMWYEMQCNKIRMNYAAAAVAAVAAARSPAPIPQGPNIPPGIVVSSGRAVAPSMGVPVATTLNLSRSSRNEKPLDRSEPVHPAMQTVQSQYPTQKTRMRTSFDQELELPKLNKWFQENQHPSRQQICSYVKELNSLESRRGRKHLDLNNVVYWFKNARAAQKRNDLSNNRNKEVSTSSLNGFSNINSDGPLGNERKSPPERRNGPSISQFSGDSLMYNDMDISNDGNISDDDEEDDERVQSPDGPLSLTAQDKVDVKEEPQDLVVDNNNSIKDVDEEMSEYEEDAPQDLATYRNSNSPPSVPVCGPPAFPLVPGGVFSPLMYMSQYIPSIQATQYNNASAAALASSGGAVSMTTSGGHGNVNLTPLTSDERRKRNRTFIDPVTEVPRLEQWFIANTHPSHSVILKYTEELNLMPYRQKFPRLEPKNVQFWFKNRRAKNKRMKISMYESSGGGGGSGSNSGGPPNAMSALAFHPEMMHVQRD